MSHRNQAEKRT